jgi:hypothetical protein
MMAASYGEIEESTRGRVGLEDDLVEALPPAGPGVHRAAHAHTLPRQAAGGPRLRTAPGSPAGTTTLKDAAAMEHMPELITLARHPNVAVKATGAPGYCSGSHPFRSMHPYLRQIHDAFGPARMFWGTDITKMPCPWRQCVTMLTEELPWLSGRGPGAGHGPGRVRLVGLEPDGLTVPPQAPRRTSSTRSPMRAGFRGMRFTRTPNGRRASSTAPAAAAGTGRVPAAQDLPLDHQRVGHVAAVVADHVAHDGHLARVGIDVEDAHVRAGRVRGL